MIRILSLLAAVLLALQGAPQDTSSVVQGVVRRSGTSEPLANVHITLTAGFVSAPLAGVSTAFSNALTANRTQPASATPGPFTTTTDSEGRFRFTGAAPGQYTVLAQLDGHFNTENGGIVLAGTSVPVNIVLQQVTPPLSLSLEKGGIVTGKVRLPSGDLASRMPVTAYELRYMQGKAGLISSSTTLTDDRGEYRTPWLSPGEYYIAVDGRVPFGISSARVSTYDRVRTFFPGIADTRLIQPVRLNSGAELTGIDITIQPLPATKISGRVVHPDPGFSGAYEFSLFSRDPDVLVDNLSPTVQNVAVDRAEGRFEIQGVLPGSYELVVEDPTRRPPRLLARSLLLGRARIEVGKDDVKDVTVTLLPAVDVKGRIRVDGSAPDFKPEGFRLSLHDILSVNVIGDHAASVNASGEFIIPGVPEGTYRFQGPAGVAIGTFVGLPPNGYVADIRQGGTSVYDSGLTIGSLAPGEVDVVIKTDAGNIAVQVVDAELKPFENAGVVAVPEGRRQNRPMYRLSGVGRGGRHTFSAGVLPGIYKVFAFESMPLYTPYQDAKFMAKFEAMGQVVTVRPGLTTETQVRVIRK